MATVRQVQITFDCRDPHAVARFWAEALGYVVADGADEWPGCSAVEDPTGQGPRLYFQAVPEDKVAKNRLHLDVRAAPGLSGDERMDAFERECDRLVALGAVRLHRLEADDVNEGIIVMQDPEGNEFCLA